jgi:hypothetical protein
MLRKNQRPFNLTDGQVQQLELISTRLRKLNRDAQDELQRIEHCYLTARQLGEAGESLGILATRMTSALQFRQGILTAGRQQQLCTIEVTFGCFESAQSRARDDGEPARDALKPDPAHRTEIASLLELTSRVEDLVATRSTRRGAPLSAFFQQVSHFTKAVLKQQRDLQATAPWQTPEIEVRFDRGDDEDPSRSYICDDCSQL